MSPLFCSNDERLFRGDAHSNLFLLTLDACGGRETGAEVVSKSLLIHPLDCFVLYEGRLLLTFEILFLRLADSLKQQLHVTSCLSMIRCWARFRLCE